MKRTFLMVLAMVAVAMTSCSQNKQSKVLEQQTQASHAQAKDIPASAKGSLSKSNNGKVSYLSTAEFKKKVIDYDKHPNEWVFEGSRPVVIDFYATWCGPCQMMAPVVEQLAKEYHEKIDFYKVDVDKEQELATLFGIESIPTFLFIPLKGTPATQMGAMQKVDFETIIKSVLLKE